MEVNLSYQSDIFRMCIRDNGRGIQNSMHKQHAFGLIGMRERVYSLFGEFNIESNDKGTTLDISVPVSSAEAALRNSKV